MRYPLRWGRKNMKRDESVYLTDRQTDRDGQTDRHTLPSHTQIPLIITASEKAGGAGHQPRESWKSAAKSWKSAAKSWKSAAKSWKSAAKSWKSAAQKLESDRERTLTDVLRTLALLT